jgi:hypothetical protein
MGLAAQIAVSPFLVSKGGLFASDHKPDYVIEIMILQLYRLKPDQGTFEFLMICTRKSILPISSTS